MASKTTKRGKASAETLPAVSSANLPVVTEKAAGGGMEGAERTSRELYNWTPPLVSPDQQINPLKDMADARGRDLVQNDGYAMGAVNTYRDGIVGPQYRLNAQPEWEVLGATEEWADEFQRVVEPMFNLLADSEECWMDAGGVNTLTEMVRLAVTQYAMTGEVLASVEWLRVTGRPFSTAIQNIHPQRLSNPDGMSDTRFLRRGVAIDKFGRPLGYHIRTGFPFEFYDEQQFSWKYVPAKKPWGRRQIIHIVEQLQPGQTRGVAELVSVMKTMKMTRKFRDITLQKAVIAASYAAAIESELPKEMIFNAMGGTGNANGFSEALNSYMSSLASFLQGAQNIRIDDSKIPHLFPGTKLNAFNLGEPGGVGGDFESSLLRHTCAALGISYEQFSKDFSKGNYAGIRAAIGETNKYMLGRKKIVADRYAGYIYVLILEELINAGLVPLPPGKTADIFYDPIMRAALTAHTWVGAPKGQIDELKETQAALMAINGNLSTLEEECANRGRDWRKVLRQRSKEKKMMTELGLDPLTDMTVPGTNDRQNTMRETEETTSE